MGLFAGQVRFRREDISLLRVEGRIVAGGNGCHMQTGGGIAGDILQRLAPLVQVVTQLFQACSVLLAVFHIVSMALSAKKRGQGYTPIGGVLLTSGFSGQPVICAADFLPEYSELFKAVKHKI